MNNHYLYYFAVFFISLLYSPNAQTMGMYYNSQTYCNSQEFEETTNLCKIIKTTKEKLITQEKIFEAYCSKKGTGNAIPSYESILKPLREEAIKQARNPFLDDQQVLSGLLSKLSIMNKILLLASIGTESAKKELRQLLNNDELELEVIRTLLWVIIPEGLCKEFSALLDAGLKVNPSLTPKQVKSLNLPPNKHYNKEKWTVLSEISERLGVEPVRCKLDNLAVTCLEHNQFDMALQLLTYDPNVINDVDGTIDFILDILEKKQIVIQRQGINAQLPKLQKCLQEKLSDVSQKEEVSKTLTLLDVLDKIVDPKGEKAKLFLFVAKNLGLLKKN